MIATQLGADTFNKLASVDPADLKILLSNLDLLNRVLKSSENGIDQKALKNKEVSELVKLMEKNNLNIGDLNSLAKLAEQDPEALNRILNAPKDSNGVQNLKDLLAEQTKVKSQENQIKNLLDSLQKS